MFVLFITVFSLQLIINIYFLVKSIKTKDNKNWFILFSLNISCIISVILTGCYSLFNNYLGWDALDYLGLCFVALCLYVLLLIVNSISKILQARKHKKQNIISKKLDKNIIRKSIMFPAVLTILLAVTICGVDYSICILHKRGEINTYNHVKRKEINKMADFLNNKYNMDIKESECVYYREQDYTRHSDIFGNGSAYNIPYIAVFKRDNEKITVVDRKDFISDNKQLKDLNDILSTYFQQKTGLEFDYIEFRKSYEGSFRGNDNIINTVLQTRFNAFITDENVEQFINCILQEPDLSVTFYIKENSENDTEALKDNITKKLDYLRDYSNIEILNVYGYDKELAVKHKEIDFPDEHKDYGNSSEDYYDGYKFGCYYIDSDSSHFTFLLSMDLDRGYTSGTGKSMNGWKYHALD